MISWKKVYSKFMKFFINLLRVIGIIGGLVILWLWLFNGEEMELWHKAMALLLVFGGGADLIIEWRKR